MKESTENNLNNMKESTENNWFSLRYDAELYIKYINECIEDTQNYLTETREIQMKEFSVKLYDLKSRIKMIYSIIKDTNNNIYNSIKVNIKKIKDSLDELIGKELYKEKEVNGQKKMVVNNIDEGLIYKGEKSISKLNKQIKDLKKLWDQYCKYFKQKAFYH